MLGILKKDMFVSHCLAVSSVDLEMPVRKMGCCWDWLCSDSCSAVKIIPAPALHL